MQMVVKLHISSLKILNKVLKERLGWDDPKKKKKAQYEHVK
jgi:hypothetical protein